VSRGLYSVKFELSAESKDLLMRERGINVVIRENGLSASLHYVVRAVGMGAS